MAVRYGDPRNGNNANDATSFANRIKGWVSGFTSGRVAAGDECRWIASPRGTLTGCSITKGASVLTVPAGNHQVITLGNTTTGWTARTDITVGTSTTRAHGSTSVSLTPATAFTTGEMAYFDLGASTDLSAFSAIFVLQRVVGSITASYSLNLYSDSGTTLIRSIPILGEPATLATHSFWAPRMFGDGAALPNNVRSIGISISADPSTTVILINNLVACHDQGVTPNSITPWSRFATTANLTDLFRWDHDSALHNCGLFLSDTTLRLAHVPTAAAGSTTYVWPHATLTSGTIEMWHGWPHDLAIANANDQQIVPRAGTSESAIVRFTGGWNRTNMSTQDADGLTIFINVPSVARGFTPAGWNKFERLDFMHWNISFGIPNDVEFEECANLYPVSQATINNRVKWDRFQMCSMGVVWTPGRGVTACNDLIVHNTTSLNYQLDTHDGFVGVRVMYNTTSGIDVAGGNSRDGYGIRNYYGADNTVDLRVISNGDLRVWNASLNSGTKLAMASGSLGGSCFVQNLDGDVNACSGVALGLALTRDTTTVDGSAVASARMLINLNVFSSIWNVDVAVVDRKMASSISGQTVTASIRYRRSSANITGRWVVKGGIIIATDQTASLSATSGTWDTATVSFTATGDGVISCHFELWSSDAVSSVYFNPESITITAV